MAEIPVERKGKALWWPWLLLGALVLALVIWLFVRDNDPEPVARPVAQPVAVPRDIGTAPPATTARAGGVITDLATIAGTADLATLVGREVRIADAPVVEMVGDRTFYVGEGARRVFVVLNEQPMPGNGVEGRYDINKGQVIDIQGAMTRVNGDSLDGQRIEGLPSGQEIVLYAQSLTIKSRP